MIVQLFAFASGAVSVQWWPWLPGPWLVAAMALIGTLAVTATPRMITIAGAVLLGMVLAVGCGNGLLQRSLPELCVRTPVFVEGYVSTLPRRSEGFGGAISQQFEFVINTLSPARCRGPRTVLLSYYGDGPIIPGQYWQFEALLKRPRGLVNPGVADRQRWYVQHGIDAIGSVRSGGAKASAVPPALGQWPNRLRLQLSEQIAELPISGSARAVLQALTVADRSAMEPGLWRLSQQFGVSHLLVISGLHIAMVAGLGFVLGRILTLALLVFLGGPRRASLLPFGCALLAAGCYTVLAGLSLPTVRAFVMLACATLAAASGRTVSGWGTLVLAASVILLWNPLAALGSGFWLSFGAVAVLLWRGLWCYSNQVPASVWQGWWHRLWQAARVHGFMCLAMIPIAGWWFGGFTPVAALANLLLVPLASFVLVPLALTGALLALGGGDELAVLCWSLAARPIEYLLPRAAQLVAFYPGWFEVPVAASGLQFMLALIGVLLLVVPAGWRQRIAATTLLVPLLVTPNAPATSGADSVHVLVLDVGQGTSVLIYDRQRALLYDTGGGVNGGYTLAENVVLPVLRQRRIHQLDTLVISHGDADHSAGLQLLLDTIPVKELIVGPDIMPAWPSLTCRAGQHWPWPGSGVTFSVLSPALEQGLSSNAGSCVLLVDVRGERVLLAGDIPARRERELVRYWGDKLASEVVVAAHHGSQTSTGWAWLKAVAPQQVIFSRGYANRFGHPHPSVVERVDLVPAEILDTASSGAIELVFEPGKALQMRYYRSGLRPYWQ